MRYGRRTSQPVRDIIYRPSVTCQPTLARKLLKHVIAWVRARGDHDVQWPAAASDLLNDALEKRPAVEVQQDLSWQSR